MSYNSSKILLLLEVFPVDYIFYIHWTIAILVFFNLARNWPGLMMEWSKVDQAMERNYGYIRNLDRRLKITAGTVIALALGTSVDLRSFVFRENLIFIILAEYILSVASFINSCRDSDGYTRPNRYYETRFSSIFTYFCYNTLLAVLVQVSIP